jgi:hypothetical protein
MLKFTRTSLLLRQSSYLTFVQSRCYSQDASLTTALEKTFTSLKKASRPLRAVRTHKSMLHQKGQDMISQMRSLSNQIDQYRDDISNNADPKSVTQYVQSVLKSIQTSMSVANKLRELDAILYKDNITIRTNKIRTKKNNNSTHDQELERYVFYRQGINILNKSIHRLRSLREFVIRNVNGKWNTHREIWNEFENLVASPMSYDLELQLSLQLANFLFATGNSELMAAGAQHLEKSLTARSYMPFENNEEDEGIYIINDGSVELIIGQDADSDADNLEAHVKRYLMRRSDYHNAQALEAFYLLGVFHRHIGNDQEALRYLLRAIYWSHEDHVAVEVFPRLDKIIDKAERLAAHIIAESSQEGLQVHKKMEEVM